jgi:excisionase family DNA binding protein
MTLCYGLTKTEMLVISGELRFLKDGRSRRILPQWVDEYVRPPGRRGGGGVGLTAKRTRANGEGSIFPYRNGYAAYVWVTTPAGRRTRKWLYGKSREDVHVKWVEFTGKASRGVVATKVPTLEEYVTNWLREVVEPNLAPLTFATYETLCRLFIVPGLGRRASTS